MFAVLVLSLLATPTLTQDRASGARVILTQKAFTYALESVKSNFSSALSSLSIDPVGINYDVYSLNAESLKISDIVFKKWTLRPNLFNNSLIFSVVDAVVIVTGKWRGTAFSFLSEEGILNLTLSGFALKLEIKLTVNQLSTKDLDLSLGCTNSLYDVSAYFGEGGILASALNFFGPAVETEIQKILENSACAPIAEKAKEYFLDFVNTFNYKAVLLEKFILDYKITENLQFGFNYMETRHKAEIYWTSNRLPLPFHPPPFPQVFETAKMLYIWISDYMVKSFAYSAYQNGYLNFVLADTLLPQDSPLHTILRTTCGSGQLCLGKVIPNLANLYPDKTIKVGIKVLQTPDVLIISNGFKVDAIGDVTFSLSRQYMSDLEIIKFGVDAQVNVTAQFKDGKILLALNNSRLKMKVLNNGGLPLVTESELSELATGAINHLVKPAVNKFGEEGFELPIDFKVFQLTNSRLVTMENFVVIESDVLLNV